MKATVQWKENLTFVGTPDSGFQVQMDAANDFISGIDYDSGFVASPLEQFDSSAVTGTPSVANGNSMYWRVRVRDAYGLTSAWSDVAQWTRQAKGTLTITSPPNGGTTEDASPTIITELSVAQNALDYQLFEDDGTGKMVKIWDAPYFAAPANAATAAVPKFEFSRCHSHLRASRSMRLIGASALR